MDRIKERLIEIDKKYKDNNLYRFTIQLYKQVSRHDLLDNGAMLTYYFILSFFPFIIFVISLISYTPIADIDFLGNIIILLPSDIGGDILNVLSQIVDSRSEALLSTSIIFATYTASKGLKGLIRSINRAYNIEEDRNFISKTILALIFTVSLAALIVVVLLMVVFGKVILDKLIIYLNINEEVLSTFHLLRLVIPAVSMFVVLTLIYKFAPNKKISLRSTFIGALFSTTAGIIMSLGFGFYVNSFANYNLTYGSLGGVIVFLVWVNLLSCVIVLGAEINSALIEIKK